MIKEHYPELFADEPGEGAAGRELAARTYELVCFLVDVRGMRASTRAMAAGPPITIPARGCASSASRRSRAACSQSVAGSQLVELPGAEVCCGFGGTFCVKYPEISDKMVGDKAADIAATGAERCSPAIWAAC